jgi:hypothetical protein
MLDTIQENIEALAGEATGQAVMQGREALKDSSKPEKVAAWMQGAMARLDGLVDAEARGAIMTHCGHNCARINASAIQRGVKRRAKYPTLEAYLAAEEADPSAGTRLERAGDVIYQYYTPRAFTHPMRCYCSLWRGLPDDQTTSLTYCQCSRGFVEKFWEAVVGAPVRVELLASAISGADECKFAIHLAE